MKKHPFFAMKSKIYLYIATVLFLKRVEIV